MNWPRVAGTIAVSGFSLVVGKLWGAKQERKAHGYLINENVELRTELEKLIRFFEGRSYNYEKIIAEIYNTKPRDKNELRRILVRYSLTDKEINRVNDLLESSRFYVRTA